jgi:hypothetical protein
MIPELHLLGFLSLFATSRARSHFSRDFPGPATFRPQAFASSRRFTPHTRLRACFIPLPRPGFSLSRGFSPRAATLPHRKELAPLPLLHRRFVRSSPLSRKRAHSHVRCHSASRPLSTRGRVPRVRLFTSPATAPLLSLVSSRSFPLSTSSPCYSAASAHRVCALGLRSSRSPFGLRAPLLPSYDFRSFLQVPCGARA